MQVNGWETGEICEILRESYEQQAAEWEAQLLRISQDFNQRMDFIIAVEWVAFGLACLALAMLVIRTIHERKSGRHSA